MIISTSCYVLYVEVIEYISTSFGWAKSLTTTKRHTTGIWKVVNLFAVLTSLVGYPITNFTTETSGILFLINQAHTSFFSIFWSHPQNLRLLTHTNCKNQKKKNFERKMVTHTKLILEMCYEPPRGLPTLKISWRKQITKELFVSTAREEDNDQCGHLRTLFDIVSESK